MCVWGAAVSASLYLSGAVSRTLGRLPAAMQLGRSPARVTEVGCDFTSLFPLWRAEDRCCASCRLSPGGELCCYPTFLYALPQTSLNSRLYIT